jgi:hypothetical protein
MEVLVFLLFALALISYFLPGIIASIRGSHHQTAICLINFFLGWTVLGWLAALIWAVVEKPMERKPLGVDKSYVPLWPKKQPDEARKREAQAAVLRATIDQRWDFPPR